MKVKFLDSFIVKLNYQLNFISKDKPKASRKFKNDVLDLLKQVELMPYKHRKSIYFDDENIREVVFKGYKFIYKIDNEEKVIKVFWFIIMEEKL